MSEHVVLPEQHEALLRHTLLAAAAGLQQAQQASDRHDIEAARTATLQKLGQVRAALCRQGSDFAG